MTMLIAGTWQAAADGRTEDVTSPFDGTVTADFLDALVPKVEEIRTGDPGSPDRTMGTLITTDEAERVEETIRRAVDDGARLLTGGRGDGATVAPAVVAGVDPRSSFSQDELFGPAMAVSSAEDFHSAIEQANGTPYGLGERNRQGGPPLGGGRDDRRQDRDPARQALVRKDRR